MTSERSPRLSPSGPRLSCDPGCLSGPTGTIEAGSSILVTQETEATTFDIPAPPSPPTLLMTVTGPNTEAGNPIAFWVDVTFLTGGEFTPTSQVAVFLMRGLLGPDVAPFADIIMADFGTSLFVSDQFGKAVFNAHDLNPPEAFQTYTVWASQVSGTDPVQATAAHLAATGVSPNLFLQQV